MFTKLGFRHEIKVGATTFERLDHGGFECLRLIWIAQNKISPLSLMGLVSISKTGWDGSCDESGEWCNERETTNSARVGRKVAYI
jgi:hypothetical protein